MIDVNDKLPGHRVPRRSRWTGMGLLVLALLAAHLALAAPAPAEPTPEPKRDPDTVSITADQMHQVSIVDVAACAFSVQKLAIGQIAFNEDASTVVLTPFSGRVTKLIAKPGDEVKRGDALFEIDSPEVLQAHTDFIAAVQGAAKSKAQLALAQRALDRQSGLFTDHATSQRELEQARNDFAAAESDVKTADSVVAGARNRLRVLMGRSDADLEKVERDRVIDSLVTIKSPIDGTVISRKIGPGQYVRSDSGEALFAISDLSTMWLKAAVPENDIPLIRVGQEIEVKVTAIPDRVLKARITAIGAASDAATRRVIVRSELPNPDHELKAEMFASFKITTSEGAPAPAVPVEAIIWDGDVATVWVETAPKVFRRRVVQVSTQQNGLVEITKGVHEGEKVVARGDLRRQRVAAMTLSAGA
jgi:membrane fusion protein, heavy metal efflux system